jgi:hypothetical protein
MEFNIFRNKNKQQKKQVSSADAAMERSPQYIISVKHKVYLSVYSVAPFVQKQ